jgi:hypothetical protein
LQQIARVNTQVLTLVVFSISHKVYFSPAHGFVAGAVLFEMANQPFLGQAAGPDTLIAGL